VVLGASIGSARTDVELGLNPALAVLAAATATTVPRCPVWLDGQHVGSLALAHRPLLAAHPGDFVLEADAVHIVTPAAQRAARLEALHRQWHAQGVIRAWRDEAYALSALDGPMAGAPLVAIERAAARFWGSLTCGAHATGFVRGADGRPAALWIAQRSAHKPTDPGLFDNLVGGGVPSAQTPAEALVREAWEEAGLQPDEAAAAVPGSVLRLARDVAEGFQLERLHSFDLELPPGRVPHNTDGEVQGFQLLPVAAALALATSGTMTVDAALVTLDFAARHGLLPAPERAPLQAALAPLRIGLQET
jgi:8-oxo-dGTP pyrophosphatase MutT (NUDIX family)